MKKQTYYSIAASVLFLFFGKLPASAQSDYMVTVQVPFEFQVNEKLLPAGKYVIRRDLMTPHILTIQCPEQNILVNVHTFPHKPWEERTRPWEERTRPYLIFSKYGENHFLTEVRMPGREEGYTLIKSKSERKLAQIAKAKTVHAITDGATTNN